MVNKTIVYNNILQISQISIYFYIFSKLQNNTMLFGILCG